MDSRWSIIATDSFFSRQKKAKRTKRLTFIIGPLTISANNQKKVNRNTSCRSLFRLTFVLMQKLSKSLIILYFEINY